ncbi:MAG: hypothetical protein HS111_23080 [Kofleriaceae bacterium]|nr:hypothetical protein [Kofleriaceae bacterium]MCL4226338.1 hypothetical protein [Myxococcales bacterium]
MSTSVLRAALVFLSIAVPVVAHAAAPTTTTSPATGITTSSAQLNGAGDPNDEQTTGWFRYSANNPVTCDDAFGTRVPATSGTDLGMGTVAVPYSITATGLTPGVTYYFCSIVQNASGTAFGAVLSFTIPAPPVTLTTGASSVTSSTATLQGSANPVASATTGWFRYATVDPGTCSDGFGTRAPASGGSALGSGTASVDFTRGITGLLPGTTYYYCAIASNAHGMTFGAVLFFTTAATAPTVTTGSATSVTTSAAVLNATGVPRGDTTVGWFRYATTNPGSCNDSFGTRLPASGGTALGADNSTVPFSQPVSGLTLATTYYYCAIAANGIGTTFGSVLSFTTSATPPTVVTGAATSVAGTSVTLNGTGTPNGSSTTAWFRYATANPGVCNDSFGTRAPTSSGSLLGAGTAPVDFSRGLTGLTPTTTYYYCAIASNGLGTSFGELLSFTTPAMTPTVTTLTPTIASGTAVTLNGQANPNGDAATGWFRYATVNPGTCDDSFGTRAPASGGSALGGGLAAVMFSEPLTGLTPLTTYYVCAIASNTLGTGFGAVQTFTTPAAPTVTTSAVSSLASVSATLNGSANPNRAATTGWFRYATTNPGTCNDSFGSRAPVSGGSNLGAGSSAQAFAQAVGSLSPDTTYYYCAIASNSEGTAFGAVLSFTTLAAPVVVSNPATLVTATSATLNGAADPNGATSTGWYRYSTSDPGTCNNSFGTRAPSSSASDTPLGAGTSPVAYSRGISGLTPNTTYYFCALAGNTYGTGFGAVLSFTTLATAPVVTTNSPTLLTGATAQLNGAANPGGADTTAWFRYATASPGTCNDSFGTRAPGAGGAALGSGTTSQVFSQAIAGLSPATTYYVCAIAQNAVGTSVGAVVSFTTPAPPTVTTTAATSIGNTTATLNGSANPNRATTTGWFRYSSTDPGTCNDSFGSRAPTSGGSNLGAGSTAQPFGQPLSALSAGTTYYYCAIASNSEGMAFGDVLSFTTAGPPTVTTSAATLVTASSATLNGSANPNGATSTGWFRYATSDPGTCNDSFGTRAPPSSASDTALGAGSSPVAYSRAISGLTPATTYYYCAIAGNTYGTRFGAVQSFTTPALPPTVTTSAVTPFTGTTAQLNGSASPNGDATTAWFRYGTVSPGTCNDSFGTRAPVAGGSSLGSGIAAVAFNQSISGLTPATTYYVCAIAQNSLGTSFGAVLTFTTADLPLVTTAAVTGLSNVAATLNGSANPNRATTTGWFRYATTNPGTCNDSFGTRAPTSGGSNLGAGSSAQAYSNGVTGLSPGTTYYYCALASNSEGTSVGAVLSFTTRDAPTVLTTAATLVAATSAQLNGSANPNGATATGWYRYATTNPGTCSDSFGTRAPSSSASDTPLGAGTSAVVYGRAISGLTPATTYYFCAIANNTHGTRFGEVLSFTTPALPPAVTTTAVTPFTGTTATFNGTANPNGDAATGWFRYATASPGTCNDSFGTRAPAAGGAALGAGITGVPFSQAVSGLSPGTTYYVCAIASNTLGTSFGAVATFTTAAPPTMTTTAATSVASTTATLAGTGNPNRAATTGWFRYATTNPGTCDDSFGTRAPAAGGTSLGAGSAAQAYSLGITGLAPATTYYYCAIGSNGEGLGVGGVLSFTTLATPTVTTSAATLVTTTSATLNGSANPNGATTTGWFRYSLTNPGTCNDSFGTRAPTSGGAALGAGTAPVAYSQALGGLLPGQTYFYCAIASNSVGPAFGAVLQLTTTAAAPSVTTAVPTGITTTTATLNGSANPNGAATTAWFRIDTTNPVTCNDSFGTRVPGTAGAALGAGNSAVTFSEALTTLTPGTTYYYCAIASNSAGTGFGIVRTFATPAPPTVATLAATPVTATTATLNASGNPNGFATTGWFRYTTTDPGACSDSFGVRAPASGGAGLGAGTAPVAFGQALTGLTPATTYYFCAIASSSIGTTLGEVLSFTTPPTQPAVTTLAATAVDVTSATLEGSANPNGDPTTAWFRYATTHPGTCNDSFGTRAPASGGTSVGAGTTPVSFSQPLTGLTTATTYYYCAIASNGIGTSLGVVMQLTTAAAPTVTTTAASGVGSSTATLNGSANPNFASTTGWFRYATTNPGTCDDSFGVRAPAAGGTSLGAGATPVAFSQALTGLSPSTTYYYCAIAQNVGGIRVGAVMSFATSSAPTVVTDAATSITSTGATLNGTANPNGLTATGWYRYATTHPGTCSDSFGTRAPSSGGTALGAGTAPVTFPRAITGLTASTTYYYCAIASNAVGTGLGEVRSFTTAGPPTVTTEAATGVTSTGATLHGSANPNQTATTGWFRYATTSPGTCNDSFGTRAPSSGGTALGAGAAAVPYQQALSTLSPGTTYFYCAIASSTLGTRFGAVMSFTTPAVPPLVTTGAATAVGASTATLNGSGNPGGAATTGYFRYSATNPGACDDSFGTRAPASGGSALGAGNANVAFTQGLTGLTSATTYYYCAIASSSAGTAFGAVLSFTTLAAPTVTTVTASAITSTGATLEGSANPNGATATGWFRYSATDPGTCNDSFGTRAPTSGGSALGAGTTAVPYTRAITGLAAGTTYYYCALASSTVGTGVGAVMSFTTPGAPTVTTSAATAVGATTATLNGAASPNAAATTGWFRYATTNPVTCNDSFGTRAPSSGGTALGAGTSAVPYAEAVSGLSPSTTYYVCAIASNVSGTRFGAVVSFTTSSTAPTVTTAAATAVTGTGATLHGAANPNGAATTGHFRYSDTDPGACDDSFGTRAPASGGAALGAGTAAVPYQQAVTGLATGTTYYYCAIATSALGTSVGAVLTFTTPAAPEVTSDAATAVGGTTATLNGTAVPRGAAATGWFRYSTTDPGTCDDAFGTRAPATGGTSLGAGAVGVPYAQALTGLAPATTYYYCAIAGNAVGTGLGAVRSVTTTAAAPTVTTDAPTDVLVDTAVLNGSVVANGAATTGWFRYGTTDPGTCNDTFGVRVPATGGTALGAGVTAVAYAEALSGLTTNTTYYACAIASNGVGTSVGAVVSFRPGAEPPVVTTEAATDVTAVAATLAGTANPNGLASIGWFRYGTADPGTCSDGFGTRAPASGDLDLGAGSVAAPFTTPLTGLLPNQRYYYCAAASNVGGASFGAVRSVTTAAVPPTVTTLSAVAGGDGLATLTGSASPNGSITLGWFRYSTVDPGQCDDSFGTRTPAGGDAALGAGHAVIRYEHELTGLAPGTYHVCAIAGSDAGTAYGELITMVVSGAPIDDGGCCHVAGQERSPWPSLLPLAVVLGLLVRRRRRRG